VWLSHKATVFGEKNRLKGHQEIYASFYVHPARQIMKNAAKRTVHQTPALISCDENCNCMQRAALKHVKTNTAPDTAPPGSQLPISGVSHWKLGFSLPAISNSTICKTQC